MTVDQLVRLYEGGQIISHHLAVEVVNLIDAVNVGDIMSTLPRELHPAVREFADQYRPNEMITNFGKIPSWSSVQAVREWFQSSREGE